MSRRRNPVIGQHPDIFAKDQWGDPGETTNVFAALKDTHPRDLLRMAKEGTLGQDVYAEIAEMEANADEDPEVLEAEGVNRPLARAITEGLYEELQANDEEGREWRIKPLVDYIRSYAAGEIEYRTSGDGLEEYQDVFQDWLADARGKVLREAAKQVSEQAHEVDEETLDAILQDPALYIVEPSSGYGAVDGAVWSAEIGDLEVQMEGWKYDETLARLLNGGWGPEPGKRDNGEKTHWYPELSDEDCAQAQKELERGEPAVYFWSGRETLNANNTHRQFYFSTSANADRIVARIDEDALNSALAEHIDAGPAAEPSKATDNVVHEFTGTNDTVAGASGRGMYVAQLTVKELRREGATLGHCIGTEKYGHPNMLREGKTKVYSIRTEAGKPKFTIEVDARSNAILEVKGKANRLPGFEPGKPGMAKPDEVRLVTEFLLSQGYTADDIRDARDVRGGVLALEEAGVDPFSPPPIKRRERKNPSEPGIPVSARVARMVQKDYNRPLGGHWGVE